jgi:hypothetical protein
MPAALSPAHAALASLRLGLVLRAHAHLGSLSVSFSTASTSFAGGTHGASPSVSAVKVGAAAPR